MLLRFVHPSPNAAIPSGFSCVLRDSPSYAVEVQAWLTYEAPSCRGELIFGCFDEAVATITHHSNFDLESQINAIAVDHRFQGRGFGRQALDHCLIQIQGFAAELEAPRPVSAKVHIDNAKSRAIFAYFRFDQVLTDSEYDLWVLDV